MFNEINAILIRVNKKRDLFNVNLVQDSYTKLYIIKIKIIRLITIYSQLIYLKYFFPTMGIAYEYKQCTLFIL